MAYLWGVWRDTLTQTQRDAWQALAEATTLVNALGEEYHPAAWPLYLRNVNHFVTYGGTLVYDAPATAISTYYPITFFWSDPNTMEMSCPTAPVEDIHFILKHGRGYPETKSYYRGPYIDTKQVNCNSDLNPVWVHWDAPYPDSSLRQFIMARAFTFDGQLSAKYYISCPIYES